MALLNSYESGAIQRTGKHSLNWSREYGSEHQDFPPAVDSKTLHSGSFRGEEVTHLLYSLIAGGRKDQDSSPSSSRNECWGHRKLMKYLRNFTFINSDMMGLNYMVLLVLNRR